MPNSTEPLIEWRLDRVQRPAEGFYTTELPPGEGARPVRTFLPEGYESRYPYPLLVLFHPEGSCEEQVLKLAPKLSRRNFIAIALRGTQTLGTHEGRTLYGWGEAENTDDTVDYLLRAVEQTRRTHHIHTERVTLVGVGEGVAPAFRASVALSDKVAGFVGLNGLLPRVTGGRPLFQLEQVRRLKAFLGHSVESFGYDATAALRDHRLLSVGGAAIRSRRYGGSRVHAEMLKDLNRWLVGQCEPACVPAGV